MFLVTLIIASSLFWNWLRLRRFAASRKSRDRSGQTRRIRRWSRAGDCLIDTEINGWMVIINYHSFCRHRLSRLIPRCAPAEGACCVTRVTICGNRGNGISTKGRRRRGTRYLKSVLDFSSQFTHEQSISGNTINVVPTEIEFWTRIFAHDRLRACVRAYLCAHYVPIACTWNGDGGFCVNRVSLSGTYTRIHHPYAHARRRGRQSRRKWRLL